jgi:hypothetical protein
MTHACGVRVFLFAQRIFDPRIEENPKRTSRFASGHHAERDDYNPRTPSSQGLTLRKRPATVTFYEGV